MKLAGFLLLLVGWVLVVCALCLLPSAGARGAFVCAGLMVELLGLGLAVRSHMPAREEPE